MASLPPGATRSAGGTVYAAVGHCIYCGSQGKLTKEHIIPYGLHGDLILPKSSCESCARITGRLETTLLKDTLGIIRTKYGFRSSNNKKRHRPATAQITRHEHDGGETIIPMTMGEMPYQSWVLPLIGPPGCGWPVTYEQLIEGDRIKCVVGAHDAQTALATAGGQRPVSMPAMKINLKRFYRTIAKIAHSYATAILGSDGFKPLLPNVILKDHDRLRNFVGGLEEVEPAKNHLYDIGLGKMTSATGQCHLVARVRLLSYLCTPTYVVAVAEDLSNKISIPKYANYWKEVKFEFIGPDRVS